MSLTPQELQYKVEDLEAAIKDHEANIKTFEQAIFNEQKHISRYKRLITALKIHNENQQKKVTINIERKPKKGG